MRQAYAMLPHVKVTDLLPHQGDHATVRLYGLPKGKAPSGIARWRTPRSSIDGTDGSISSSRSNLLWYSEDHVEILGIQKLGLAMLEAIEPGRAIRVCGFFQMLSERSHGNPRPKTALHCIVEESFVLLL